MKNLLTLAVVLALCLPGLAQAEDFKVEFKAKFLDETGKPVNDLIAVLVEPGHKIKKWRAESPIRHGHASLDLVFDKWQAVGLKLKLKIKTPAGAKLQCKTASGNVPAIEYQFHYQPRSTKEVQFLSGDGSVKAMASYAKPVQVDWTSGGPPPRVSEPEPRHPRPRPGLKVASPVIPGLQEVKVLLPAFDPLVVRNGVIEGMSFKFLFKDAKGSLIKHEKDFEYDLQICALEPKKIKNEVQKVLWEVAGARGTGDKFKRTVMFSEFQIHPDPVKDRQIGMLKATVRSGGKVYESTFSLGVYIFSAKAKGGLHSLNEVKVSGFPTDTNKDKKKDAYKFNMTFWNLGGILSFNEVPYTLSYKLFAKKPDGSKGKLLKQQANIKYDTSNSLKTANVIPWPRLKGPKAPEYGILEAEVKIKVRGKVKTFTATENRVKLRD
ncbi:MAG: hypothetical protein JXR96_28800 [Deltaproteobacteria bacterium]|nr:hypothetical protein [Deltaproteobacteria bacterium]